MDPAAAVIITGALTTLTTFILQYLGSRQTAKRNEFEILSNTVNLLQTQIDRLAAENTRLQTLISQQAQEFRNRESLLRAQLSDLQDENAWLKVQLREHGIAISEKPKPEAPGPKTT